MPLLSLLRARSVSYLHPKAFPLWFRMKIEVEKVAELGGHRDCIYALERGTDANTFFSAGGDGWVVRWNLQGDHNGELVARLGGSGYSLQYLPEQNQMLAATNAGTLHLLDLQEKQELQQLELEQGIFALLACPQHNLLLLACAKGHLHALTLDGWEKAFSFRPSTESIRTLALHPQRAEVAAGFSDGHIRVFSLPQLRELYELPGHPPSTFSLHYSRYGSRLFSGGRDAQLKSWRADDGYEHELTVPAHRFTINRMALHPSGRYLATASRDKTVKVWDTQTLELLKVIDREKYEAHNHSVNHLIWLDKRHLATAGDDKRVLVWRLGLPENP